MTGKAQRYGLIVAGFILVADQLLKWIIISPLALETVQQITLLPIFNLTWTRNYGVALGMFQAESEAARWFLTAITAGIAGLVAFWLWQENKKGEAFGLGLILGGAIGNIFDRLRFGYVVDFLDLHFGDFRPFLIFNLADAAITIGVVILVVRAIRDMMRGQKDKVETEDA